MAYVFTGNKRSLTVLVTKKDAGGTIVGYPNEYDGRLAFGSYSAITDDQMQKLTDSEFATRLAALYAFIESEESGFDSSADISNQAIEVDLTECPTTTTTVAPTTTTTTTVAPTTVI